MNISNPPKLQLDIPQHAMLVANELRKIAPEYRPFFHYLTVHLLDKPRKSTMFLHQLLGRLSGSVENIKGREAYVFHDTAASVPPSKQFLQWRRVTVELYDVDDDVRTKRFSGVFYPDGSWGMEFGPDQQPTKNLSSVTDVARFIAEFLVNNTILESPYANGKHQEST